jgi:membrane protease YdiL (CAAX protease family)
VQWPVGGDEARWGVPAAVVCLLAAQVAASVWYVVTAGAVYGSDGLPDAADRPIWTLLLFNTGLWLAYLLGPVILHRINQVRPMVADFDLRISPIEGVMAVVVGLGAQLLVLPALYWVVLLVVDGDPSAAAQALADRVDGVGDGLLFTISVVGLAPVIEEWFYRGLLLPTLVRRFGSVAGWIGSSAVFALVHGQAILLPGLFVLAVLLSWLTARTGRIGPAVLAHMVFNATTVVQLLVL